MPKLEPNSVTIVTECNVAIVDRLKKRYVLNGSMASPVGVDQDVASVTAIVGPNGPLVLQVNQSVIVKSFDSFLVAITINGTTVTTTCLGLFMFAGRIDRLEISPIGESVRIQYVCA